MTLSIRTAAPTDADVIAGLMTQLGYPATGQEVLLRLAYWLGDPASQVLVAVLDGQIAGCLSLHAVPYLERTGRWARIESFVVDQAVRGNGIGAGLLAAAEDLAAAWGCLSVEVTSSRSRPGAHAFYQHMGYTDICGQSGRFVKALNAA